MCADWSRTRLKELAILLGGFGFPEHLQGRVSDELPFYKVSDMSLPGNERFMTRANHYVSKSIAARQGWKPAPAQSIAFAKVGAALLLNRRRILSRSSLVDNNMMVAVADGTADPGWLYWWFQTIDFCGLVQPGALPSVNQRQIGDLEIDLPPLPEQHRIAEILDTLDEAIRKTEQVIAKLEQMKQGLLHDLLTRGVDENGELRDPVRFPEQFKESELGLIPRGWEVRRLGKVLERIDAGWSPNCLDETPKPGQWGVLKVSAVSGGIYRPQETKLLPANLQPMESLEVSLGDVLCVRANGVATLVARTVYVESTPSRLMLSDKTLRLVPGHLIRKKYLSFLMEGPRTRQQVQRLLSGSSGQRNISQSQLESLKIAVPSPPEQERIEATIAHLDTRVRQETEDLKKLQTLKKGLMHDLLTGRVRTLPPGIESPKTSKRTAECNQ